MRSVLYFAEVDDFEAARDALIRSAALVSAAPPALIVSSLDAESPVISGMRGVEIVTDPLPEDLSGRMPNHVRLAALTLIAPEVTAQNTSATETMTTEGVAWDAPGYQAPGRPQADE